MANLNPRILSEVFMNDLKSGLLKPILDRVKADDTLMLAIRKDYINIYYRGGNLMRIDHVKGNKYSASFNENYDIAEGRQTLSGQLLPGKLKSEWDVNKWLEALPNLKQLMDFWFVKHPKLEREYQQVVYRENNCNSQSNNTEYFFSDIEYTESKLDARFDMVAIKWKANSRKLGKCGISFIEMKYGEDSINEPSGLISHIRDFNNFIHQFKDDGFINSFVNSFNQLTDLGLIKYNPGAENKTFQWDGTNPEFIFLLANRNPRSQKLKNILNDKDFLQFASSTAFNLRFALCNDAGYSLHTQNILTLEEYVKII